MRRPPAARPGGRRLARRDRHARPAAASIREDPLGPLPSQPPRRHPSSRHGTAASSWRSFSGLVGVAEAQTSAAQSGRYDRNLHSLDPLCPVRASSSISSSASSPWLIGTIAGAALGLMQVSLLDTGARGLLDRHPVLPQLALAGAAVLPSCCCCPSRSISASSESTIPDWMKAVIGFAAGHGQHLRGGARRGAVAAQRASGNRPKAWPSPAARPCG